MLVTCLELDALQDAAQVSSSVRPADSVSLKGICVMATMTAETTRMKPTVDIVNVISLFVCHVALPLVKSLSCNSQAIVQCNEKSFFSGAVFTVSIDCNKFRT